MKANYSTLCGGLLIVFSLFVRYYIQKRRFNRRGIAGLQQFKSYHHFIIVTAIEKILLLIGNLCGLAGLILLAVAGFNHFKF